MEKQQIHWKKAWRMRTNVNSHQFAAIRLIYLDMIIDNDPMIARYISTPKEISSLNCAAFYCGVIEAVLKANGIVIHTITKIRLIFID